MIGTVLKKTFATLMKKPLKLWGLSLLVILLTSLANTGFIGVPAVAFAISVALEAGMAMIFLNSYRTGLEPKTEFLFAAFKKDRFLHVVGGMAWMALWIFLWGLIPVVGPIFAIIRTYEYRFTPYILMTRDDVKAVDAIKISKEETMGYKSQMFWADMIVVAFILAAILVLGTLATIPFIGWLFALALTLVVIAYLALVSLFRGIMKAAFYVEIKTGAGADAPAETASEEAVPVIEAAAEEAPAEEAPAEETPDEPTEN